MENNNKRVIMICKTCRTCKTDKPETADYFHRDSGSKSGLKAVCRVCANIRQRTWNKENPNYAAEYRAKANRDQIKDYNAAWAKANTEKVKLRKAARYKANPEKKKASVTAWRKASPAKHKAIEHKRRALKLAAGGSFSAAEIKDMLKQQKGKCIVCKVDIINSYHIDHIMPLALGGHNGIQNIQLLCQHCNCSKHAKHPIAFMQSRGYLL